MSHLSFGQYPRIQASEVIPIYWPDQSIDFNRPEQNFLCYAQGRSYGDSCLNEHGILLETKYLNRFIEFDTVRGLLKCEAGITFAEILRYIVPNGWFLPVVPGTQFISLGGAIANDIHGKNHQHMGTFGRFVKQFELLRSDQSRMLCTPHQNRELYQATIGGLGLTGLITWAEIELIPIQNAYLQIEKIKFNTIEEYVELDQSSHATHQYTVAWLDTLSAGRGVFMRANHASEGPVQSADNCRTYTVPNIFPSFTLNTITIRAFNAFYYRKHSSSIQTEMAHYQTFFFQLDKLHHWNRLYGKSGFLQYQCVLPSNCLPALKTILTTVNQASAGSFLSVLKTFGGISSPGLLSFPQEGFTLALDFPLKGKKTLALLNQLDEIVMVNRGRVYPAKDARMSSHVFKQYYPDWQSFLTWKDPKFSSSFWRRVLES